MPSENDNDLPPLDLPFRAPLAEEEQDMDLATLLSDARLADMAPELHDDESQKTSLRAIRDLQLEHDALFGEYIREKQELEDRFEKMFAPIITLRKKQLDDNPIKLFWFKAFEHCEVLRENITDRDAVALQYLTDVSCETVTMNKDMERSTAKGLPVGSFVLTFRFADNPFFENDVLTKTYVMSEDDFEDLDEARGSKVLWKAGKDLTMRTMKKKSKNGRTLIRQQPTDSFFNFFNPPASVVEDEAEMNQDVLDELEDVIDADFELGDTIRSEVIPRALLYYLNVAEQDDESEEGDEYGADDEEDESEERGNGGGRTEAGVNGQRRERRANVGRDEDDSDESPEEDNVRRELPPAAQSPEECKQQ